MRPCIPHRMPLAYNRSRLSVAFQESAVIVDILTPEHPERELANARIAAVYRRAYGARLEQFMPNLMRVAEDDGSFRAVLGIRSAESGPLFLEAYLDEPMEQAIAARAGQAVKRDEIVEIGNLAESKPGDARLGIISATMYLHTMGFRWVALTVVPQLVNSFKRLGIELVDLAPADPMRLPEEERGAWGSYYDTNPMVCYADIAAGFASLCEFDATWLGARKLAEQELQSWDNRSL